MDFENLSEEQKAKMRACGSVEEVLAVVESEGIEVSDEQLENIAGGWSGADCPDGGGDGDDIGMRR